jgi:hypothetical protein
MDYKELYSNFNKKLPFTRIQKWYDKDKDGSKVRELAELEINVFRSGVGITVGRDLKNDRLKRENWINVYGQIDTMYSVFALCKQFVQSSTQTENMKIPVVKVARDDNGKRLGDSTLVNGHVIIGRNEKEFYFGVIQPQKSGVHFLLHPPMPGKQWLVARKDETVDTITLSKVYAINYFDRILRELDIVKDQLTEIFNKAFPMKVKEDTNKPVESSNTDDLDLGLEDII